MLYSIIRGGLLVSSFLLRIRLRSVGDTTYKVNFADWMYLLDKDTLLARSYMNKWGFDLGEVTIVMNIKRKLQRRAPLV